MTDLPGAVLPPIVAGVDEAGRGPWAGPVVAAAVILGPKAPRGLNDSKALSAARRKSLFDAVMEHCVAVSFAATSSRKIDETDVLHASLAAMRRAVDGLPHRPDVVHVDGNRPVPGLSMPQRTIVRGDASCPAVAAASIVAKVVRDRMMALLDEAYPQYGFHRHKGYGTAEHRRVLNEAGPCPVHRYSFAPIRNLSLFSSDPSSPMKHTAN